MKRRMPSIPAPALGIFCLAFMVRVVYNLTVANHYVAGYDSQAYESIALHIINEHCFCKDPFIPTIGRAPLWPGIIAAIYTMTGYHNFYVRLFLCFIGSGTCVLVYMLVRDL